MRYVFWWDFTQHKILQECRFQQENYFFLCRTRRERNVNLMREAEIGKYLDDP
jgi:hypothetical protein